MKTISEIDAKEKIAFDLGLRGDALESEFQRRAARPAPIPNHAKKFVDYLIWLHKQRSEMPPFKAWAKSILGMPVDQYLGEKPSEK